MKDGVSKTIYFVLIVFVVIIIFFIGFFYTMVKKTYGNEPILEVEKRDNTFEYGKLVTLNDFIIISDAQEVVISKCEFDYDGHKTVLNTDGYSFVIPYKIGKLIVSFKATGFNKKEIETSKEYVVIDKTKPEIVSEYNYDTTINDPNRKEILSDIYAYDDIDGELPVNFDMTTVDFDVPGTYCATVYAMDSSNNFAEQSVKLNIHNQEPEDIVIETTNDVIELHPGESIKVQDYYSVKDSNNNDDYDKRIDIMVIEPPMDTKADPYLNIVNYDKERKTITYVSPGEVKIWISAFNGYKYSDADFRIVCVE